MRRRESISRWACSCWKRTAVKTAPIAMMASIFHPKIRAQSGGKLPPPQNTGCGCWVPPLDREDDDGDVDEGEDAEDGGEGRALRGFFDGAPQHQVSGIEEPTDERAGEPGVPGPPDAPDDTTPDRSRDQVAGEEGEPDFGHGYGGRVPDEVLRDKEEGAGDEGDEGAGERGDRHRHVEEDDLEDGSLAGLLRKSADRIDIAGQKDDGESAKREKKFISHSFLVG